MTKQKQQKNQGERTLKKYFAYLEELRERGETNMMGAVPYLQRKFPELAFERARAVEILMAWFHSFAEEEETET